MLSIAILAGFGKMRIGWGRSYVVDSRLYAGSIFYWKKGINRVAQEKST